MELNPRIKQLLADITNLSDEELAELRDLIMAEVDKLAKPAADKVIATAELSVLESLAASAEAVTTEVTRRTTSGVRASAARDKINQLVPADRRPRYYTSGNATALTAAGAPLHDRLGLAEEFLAAMRQQRAPGADGRTLVATLRSAGNHPALRSTDSPEAITAALTAAGGLGGTGEERDYQLPGFDVVDRPVRSALAVFVTERGGIRFMRSPTLADLAGAVGVWSVQTDIDAAKPSDSTTGFVSPRKNIMRVSAKTEVAVNTQAVTSRLLIGNLLSMAYPELVARYVDLAAAQHARVAERELINTMDALSTQVNVTGTLGAARVLLPTLDRAAVSMRDRLRAAPDASVTVVMPAWVKGLLRSDLAAQHPGDATLGVSEAELAAFFASRNIVPVYSLDTQNFADQAAGALIGWNANVKCWLHLSGSFVFMDGGTLDLGLVRDSTLNAANDYEIFSESFEALVQRVPASLAVTVPVSVSGASAGAA